MAIIEKIRSIFRTTDKNRHTGEDFEEVKEEHRTVFYQEHREEDDDQKTPHVNAHFSSVNVHLAASGGKYAESNILTMPNPAGSMTAQGAKKDEGEELKAESKTNLLKKTGRNRRGNTGISRGAGRR